MIRLWLKQFGRNQRIAGLHFSLANCILSFQVRFQLFCVPSLNSRSKASILQICSILCWMQEKENWNNSVEHFTHSAFKSLSQMKRSWIITEATIHPSPQSNSCEAPVMVLHSCTAWFMFCTDEHMFCFTKQKNLVYVYLVYVCSLPGKWIWALAMVYALHIFKYYMLGNRCVFYVDHMALLHLITNHRYLRE